jgi:hypothetical protein
MEKSFMKLGPGDSKYKVVIVFGQVSTFFKRCSSFNSDFNMRSSQDWEDLILKSELKEEHRSKNVDS